MSNKGMLLVALALIAIIGFVPIMGKIGENVGKLPYATPLDVPSALKKTESTFASSSAESHTATPSGAH
jgi:hypothetical protein